MAYYYRPHYGGFRGGGRGGAWGHGWGRGFGHGWGRGWGRGRGPGGGRRWPWLHADADAGQSAWAQGCLAQLFGPGAVQDGASMHQAIQQFQAQQQLPPTGILDGNTVNALQAACATQQGGGGQDVDVPPPPPFGEMGENEQSIGPVHQSLPRRWRGLSGESEFETPHAHDDPRLLAFKIPEEPYSDSAMRALEKTLDVIEAVGIALDAFAPEVGGMLGIAVKVAVSVVKMLFAGATGFAEARADVSRKNMRTGFSWGLVAGADGRKWPFVKDLFWMAPGSGPDPDLALVAQKALRIGLVAGYLQGREVARNPKKKEFFWRSIGRTLTQGDLAQYGGDQSRWGRRDWINWYVRASVSFQQLYLKD